MTVKKAGMESSYIPKARVETSAKAENAARAAKTSRSGSRVGGTGRDSLTLSGERVSQAPSLGDIRRRLVDSVKQDAPADKVGGLASRVADGSYRLDPEAIARAMAD